MDFALRRLVGDALSVEEALALQGTGFDYTNEQLEEFSLSGRSSSDPG